jgi:hypothetical protein
MVPTQGMPTSQANASAAAANSSRADGFHPQNVDAAFLEPVGLFVEHLDRQRVAERTHRFHDLARRARQSRRRRPWPARGVGHVAADLGGDAVEFAHALLRIVQREPRGVAAKGVGEEQVAARLDRAAVERADLARLVGVPQLGRIARLQAHVAKSVVPVAPSARRTSRDDRRSERRSDMSANSRQDAPERARHAACPTEGDLHANANPSRRL